MSITPYGPSGECEGVPCYTPTDKANTQSAKATATSARATAQAVLEAAQTAFDGAELTEQEWDMQLQTVEENLCP